MSAGREACIQGAAEDLAYEHQPELPNPAPSVGAQSIPAVKNSAYTVALFLRTCAEVLLYPMKRPATSMTTVADRKPKLLGNTGPATPTITQSSRTGLGIEGEQVRE